MAGRMVDIGERIKFAWERLASRSSSPREKWGGDNGPPGGVSMGTSWLPGPSAIDSWGAVRGPSPFELIETFKSVSYFCANVNANAVASTPLRLYMDSGRGPRPKDISDPRSITRSQLNYLRRSNRIAGGSRVDDIHEIRNHPFLNTLRKPDPDGLFDLYKLLSMVCRYCDVVGAAYFWPSGNRGMPYSEIWPLFSQFVLPIRKAGRAVIGEYQYFAERFAPDEILVFKHYESLRDPYGVGYPPSYAAAMYLKLEDEFVTVQKQLLAMGPRPAVIASPKDPNMPVGQVEKERFEIDLNRKHARGMQGGVLVVNGSWDFSPVSYSPTDLSGLKVAEYDLERSCSCFDCPIEFFTPDTNLANLEAAERKHATKGVRPRCHSIAMRLTNIVQRWDSRLFFGFDNPDPTDEERETKVFDMKIRNGSITINQANAETGIPPVPWGDKPWQPNNLITPDMAEEAHKSKIALDKANAAGLKAAAEASKAAAENPGVIPGKPGGGGGSANQSKKPLGNKPAGGRPKSPNKGKTNPGKAGTKKARDGGAPSHLNRYADPDYDWWDEIDEFDLDSDLDGNYENEYDDRDRVVSGPDAHGVAGGPVDRSDQAIHGVEGLDGTADELRAGGRVDHEGDAGDHVGVARAPGDAVPGPVDDRQVTREGEHRRPFVPSDPDLLASLAESEWAAVVNANQFPPRRS